jgi:uncharacterized protein
MKTFSVIILCLLSWPGFLNQAGKPNRATIAAAARDQIGKTVRYDPSYRALAYPNGDVPIEGGVCTDVVVRALRASLNLDLQERVHEDMKRHFSSYPRNWGLNQPDRNIDHRRVPNLQTYFTRSGFELPISRNPRDFEAGDLVTCIVPPHLPHIMIVSDRRNSAGQPLVIHNIGAGVREEDRLFEFTMTGHYRLPLQQLQESGPTQRDARGDRQPREDSPLVYTVGTREDGGTLSGIALLFYGDARQWRRIYEANRDTVRNPDIIRQGMRLTIPNTTEP